MDETWQHDKGLQEDSSDNMAKAVKNMREDIEAAQWVREHGGLEEIKNMYYANVELSYELSEWKREVYELCEYIGVNHENCHGEAEMLKKAYKELGERLMPLYYFWPKSAFRYNHRNIEIGTPFLDENGNEGIIDSVTVYEDDDYNTIVRISDKNGTYLDVKSNDDYVDFPYRKEREHRYGLERSLKTCPHCGGEAHFHEHEKIGVECIECGTGFGCVCDTHEEAADLWNAMTLDAFTSDDFDKYDLDALKMLCGKCDSSAIKNEAGE